jgi:uncharacterized membrane protein YesL
MRGFYTAYIHIGGMVYMAFMTNFLLVISNLPLLFFFVATDVRTTWLPVLVLAPFLAISLAAAFSVFQRFTVEGTVSVVREFVGAWRARARGAGVAGAVAGVGLFVLAVDVMAVSGSPFGTAATSLFLTLMALLVATALHVLVAIVLGVEARSALALWKACLYFAVRRWYLTVMSLFALLLLISFIYAMPAWGAGLVASPILYVAWTNSRQALLPIAPTADRTTVDA